VTSPFDPIRIFTVLAAHDVDYVLIGGLAAVIRGSTATTNDADVVPARDEENLERLSTALSELEARLRVDSAPDGVAFDPHPALIASMAMLNLTTTAGDLDLTFSPTALDDYGELVGASEWYELGGHRVRVASLEDIIRSKRAADRPKDRAVLPILDALRDEIARHPDG